MNSRLLLLISGIFILGISNLYATHNRAGEIHIKQIGPLTVRATIVTWTKTSSVNADRDTLSLNWGDGTIPQSVLRSNGEGFPLDNDVKYNIYIAEHTYAGPATYLISMTDPNRNAGILNVNPPSSDNVPFHIQTTYSFQDQQFGGYNTTPYLLQPPIDDACIGIPFKHNPNAYDEDGDSLSFQFTIPLFGINAQVPNYTIPNLLGPGSNSLTINGKTGEILWTSPEIKGEYNIAFIIISWRGGVPIDTTIRDMQIFVDDCDNRPPVVATIQEICVVAGDTLVFPVQATDPDTGQLVRLTALGGPFTTPFSPATFTVPSGYRVPPVNGTFRWITTCEHIAPQPYSVVFKALDTLGGTQLSDLKSVSIRVVGPPPLDVQVVTNTTEAEISWEKPYTCEEAANDYFYAFSVWRREGSNPFVPDSCEIGLDGRGYSRLIFATKQEQNGRYFYKDKDVESGRTYCYRVLAIFARRSSANYPYNLVESLPSEEVCVQLPRNLPLITQVTVESTDAVSGQMEISWSKPVAADLDTILNHGPYRYQLLRAPQFSGGSLQPVPGADFVSNTFWGANDTVFRFDENLNTQGNPYHYQVAFYVKGETEPLGTTNEASSVFLSVGSTDQTNLLTWASDVPWANYRYDIFRKNNTTGAFDSIGSAEANKYDDRGLTNGISYCYYVRSVGTYSIEGVLDPIVNHSQEACGTPIDTVPPCPPVLTVTNVCDDQNASIAEPPYENKLTWTNPNQTCNGTDDVVSYKVWFAPEQGLPLTLIGMTDGATSINFSNFSDEIAGCFAVSALDSVGNESARSNIVCKDNCPKYDLPNTFTPNDDGANDVFKPFPNYRFIERIDMQIFNRWGNLVFETQDAAINWNGTNEQGKTLNEGTYFYVCRVYEKRVTGAVLRPDVLNGYIELVRGR